MPSGDAQIVVLAVSCPIYGAQTNVPGATPPAPWITHKHQLKPLNAQPQALAQQLSQIQRRVEELEKRRM